ncbi:unnamed protein product [Hydatigera taeniaeformis]|uniref:Uncharacterized protein n=1 Tax=Hydatigena taeniaeformis TaxID=6205 RepID=A0A0R3XBG7_HYDTA|nr:unnamed protein product [Hydatigera taeniaeformis]
MICVDVGEWDRDLVNGGWIARGVGASVMWWHCGGSSVLSFRVGDAEIFGIVVVVEVVVGGGKGVCDARRSKHHLPRLGYNEEGVNTPRYAVLAVTCFASLDSFG